MRHEDFVRLSQLFDYYGRLLTEKQQELFELHFHYDLSLAEIADQQGVSRQAVHDLLRRTSQQLEVYENALQLLSKDLRRHELLDQLETNLDSQEGLSQLRQLLGQIRAI